jgi:hypothetical protein
MKYNIIIKEDGYSVKKSRLGIVWTYLRETSGDIPPGYGYIPAILHFDTYQEVIEYVTKHIKERKK